MSGNSHNSNDDAEERVDFASLLPPGRLQALVQQWLHDDIPTFDVGGLVVGAVPRTAFLWMKSSGIVAGIPIVDAVFQQLHCQVTWHVREGESIRVSADCADVPPTTTTSTARKARPVTKFTLPPFRVRSTNYCKANARH
jgi:hypothetical protein